MGKQQTKPRVFIAGIDACEPYVRAITLCGGEPTVGQHLPEGEEFDALILSGGCDVEPARYGEEINGARELNPARDEAEAALFRRFTEEGKPVLGICRGLQLMNALAGGTLIQHLPTADDHAAFKVHSVTAEPDSFLSRLFGEAFVTNTSHHQAIDRVAPGFRVVARHPGDSVIEAVENPEKRLYAVQFHPERMCDGGTETVDAKPLFLWFLSLCR